MSTINASAAEFDEFGPVVETTQSAMSTQVATIFNSPATKSDKIRQLLAIGMKRGDVAKLLGIRYQHVRNVEITPIKRK